MGREIKRVPLDFEWPYDVTWEGYEMPDSLAELPCGDCDGSGYSLRGRYLKSLWYGYVPFSPEGYGSVSLTPETPAVRAFAERNVSRAPEFYGTDELSIATEAKRLAGLWNQQWSHHLNADDVAALAERGRLHDFTHRWTKDEGWKPIDPPVVPTPEQVNTWHIATMGHDSINAMIAIEARCEREGEETRCSACHGHGSIEAYEGQRVEAEAWERTEPPTGEGWQLWQTVSEGSPISPVFESAEALARWMSEQGGERWFSDGAPSYETALRFVGVGWAPTGGTLPGRGFVDGVELVGRA